MIDCVIKNGTVIDGTGSKGVRADVGIKNGRIIEIGKVTDGAKRTVDAEGKVVAPGFVDVHTHYDAQVSWDPALTPSSLHGVTTVVGGNCGFTLAPVVDSSIDYVTRMLACVEGMPVEALQTALKFDWRSYSEWLSKLEGNMALNAGFMVGHSTTRRMVMGEDWRRAATDAEIEKMAGLISESIDAGALGFSSSWGSAHSDHMGDPVPSRFADQDELLRLSSILRSKPGTSIEFIPPTVPAIFEDKTVKLMSSMSAAAGKSLNWNLVAVGLMADSCLDSRISTYDKAEEIGGKVVALALPIPLELYINLPTTIVFNPVAEFRKVLALPHTERLRALSDPNVRTDILQAIVKGGHEKRLSVNFANYFVVGVANPKLKSLEGRQIKDIAKDGNRTPFDIPEKTDCASTQ